MANITVVHGSSANGLEEPFDNAQVRFDQGWCYVVTPDGIERQFDPFRWSRVIDRDSGTVLGESPEGA